MEPVGQADTHGSDVFELSDLQTIAVRNYRKMNSNQTLNGESSVDAHRQPTGSSTVCNPVSTDQFATELGRLIGEQLAKRQRQSGSKIDRNDDS